MNPSPCIKKCILDETLTYCTGCHRTLSEIQEWSRVSPRRQQEILRNVEERKKQEGGAS
jgi:predicted Fe-S protein YdhL (DUF1289 family)